MKTNLIKTVYRKISIKTKLILIVCILMACSIIFLGYLGYQSYAMVFQENAVNNSQKNVHELTNIVSERVDRLVNLSLSMLYDEKIYDANKNLLSPRLKEDILAEQTLKNDFESYLKTSLNARPEIDMVFFRFSDTGKVYFETNDYYTYNNNQMISITSKKILNEFPREGKGKPIWYFDKKDGKLTGIYLGRIVYDRDSGREIGILVFKVNPDHLFGVVKNFLANKMQNISIFSEESTEVYCYNSFEGKYQKPGSEIINTSSERGKYTLHTGKDQIFIIYDQIPSVKWKLVVYISSGILLSDLRKVLNVIILLCILTLPLWIIMINFIFRDLIKPINILVDSMHKLEKGEMGVTLKYNREDELGFVFKTFNKMSEEINRLINKVYKEEIAMKDAEIKALQAQINPHFLYNTLEAINWKSQLYGVSDISEMVTALSAIIDANLDRNNEKMIPLKREIEYIDNYNFLIQKRFGKKITFVKSVHEDALNFEIPKLLIQPLIENAIYHGLETKKGGGTVELIITIEEGMLLIIVADDGTGIEDEVLKHLKLSLEENIKTQYESRTKIGIMNVHRRIKLIYGEDYGLKIFSEEGKGTTIMLKLPFDVNKGVEVYD